MVWTNIPRIGWYPIVALTALSFGFLIATQLRTQLIPPSAQVARNQALVGTVQRLERDNATYRSKIAGLRTEITGLESQAAARSDSTRRLAGEVADLRAHAGLTRVHGPGETVTIGNGKPLAGAVADTAYLVDFQDVQDVVNLLFQGGAEAVAVNGHRMTPASRIQGAGLAVLIDQGPPLTAPFQVQAVGNRDQMDALLAQSSSLGDLKRRQQIYQVQLGWQGAADLTLPAADSTLSILFAHVA